MYLTLVPAYGRDYKSKKEVLAAFDANKDFMLQSFDRQGLTSKQELAKLNPGAACNIRYKRLTQIVVTKV